MDGLFTNGAGEHFVAITFDELVQYGIAQCKAEGRSGNIVNGMPWSFSYRGIPVTHENDGCYLVCTPFATMPMTPDHILVVNAMNNAPLAVGRNYFADGYLPLRAVIASGAPDGVAADQAKRLVEIARKFIDDNHVSCPEATASDKVYENAPDLVEQLAEAVGYYQYPDDDEG